MERFGFSKSAVLRYVNKVAYFIVSDLSDKFLSWPDEAEKDFIRNEFEAKKGIPDVVGAIDSSHIRIAAPSEFKNDYFNRKQYYYIAFICKLWSTIVKNSLMYVSGNWDLWMILVFFVNPELCENSPTTYKNTWGKKIFFWEISDTTIILMDCPAV